MAWRDSRASRRRLVLFSLSIVLGIAALVAIGSFGASLEEAVNTEAKGLLGADLVVISRAPLDAAVRKYLDGLGGKQAREYGFSSMMVFPKARHLPRLVQVRAMQGGFPFYGDFKTTPSDAPEKLWAAERKAPTGPAPGALTTRPPTGPNRFGGAVNSRVAILEETLMQQFGVRVGDPVTIGNAEYTVVGGLEQLPGEGSAVAATFAPRVLIPMASLAATGLTRQPTLARYRTMLKLPADEDPEAVVGEMRRRFAKDRLGYDTVARRKRELGRTLENVQGFLSLVGFVALFLGAIGVASGIAVYVRQKIPTVAVLRCLGATVRQSFAVYLVQGFALGLFGAFLGSGFGVAVQSALPRLLGSIVPFHVVFSISWQAVLRGAIAGFVICALFAMLPLLTIRRVSPAAAFRSEYAESAGARRDPWRIAVGLFIALAVVGFSIWQTRSYRLGTGFAGVLGAGLGLLAVLAKALTIVARKASSPQAGAVAGRRVPFVLRQGVANLHRPRNRTLLLVFALGLGTFLILTLDLTRATLLHEVQMSGGGDRPNLLFFDIQESEIAPLTKLLAAGGSPVRVNAPIVTMRIAAIKGRSVADLLGRRDATGNAGRPNRRSARFRGAHGEGIPAWTLRREYRSTYRSTLSGTERVVEGRFVGRVPTGTAIVPVSVEQGLMRQMQLHLGDEIDWDVQGVPLRSRVTSVRAVEWRRLEPNFFVVFPRGVLEAAPKFFVVALRAATPSVSARLQREVVTAFPDVTAIDLRLIMATLDGVFSKVAFVVKFMALFTVATGAVVLVSAVLTGRYQRIRESVLLRTLGATRRQLTWMTVAEYAALGVLAATAGGALASAANFLLSKYVFSVSAEYPVMDLVTSVLGVTVLTLVTGVLANKGVSGHPPLEVLRQEV